MGYSAVGMISVLVMYLVFLAIGMGVTFAIILLAINKSKVNKNLEKMVYLLEDVQRRLIEKEDK
jgi:hypothetical protein